MLFNTHTEKEEKYEKKQVIKPIIRNVCYCLIRALVIVVRRKAVDER